MKLVFYAPFKPHDHPNASGDRAIARGIIVCLEDLNHDIEIPSHVRMRWIFWSPRKWPALVLDFIRCLSRYYRNRPDVWITYHCYYKAPDILGPLVCGLFNIPYLIFSASYASKRKRRFKTIPGYALNRFALSRANGVLANSCRDYKNLKRIIKAPRLGYVPPGIDLARFSPGPRKKDRKNEGKAVILTAAMFRPDVKTQGLIWLIQCCADLAAQGGQFLLKIAGHGPMAPQIQACAQKYLPGRHQFSGRIPSQAMPKFYRSGHIFAFPGIRESLGMVFLEAQACGLPVVAFDTGGIPDIVISGKTGFLVPCFNSKAFSGALDTLIKDRALSELMGRRARENTRMHHDINSTRRVLAKTLSQMIP